MDRDEALTLLRAHKPALAQRFGVVDIALLDRPPAVRRRPRATLTSWSPLTDPRPPSAISVPSSTWKISCAALSIWSRTKRCARSCGPMSRRKPSVCRTSREQRQWRLYVSDMIEFAEKVQTYTEGMDRTAFLTDSRTYDATLRNLELIGEAAIHVQTGIREAHPEVPWRTLVGMRNRIIHGYLGLDTDLIWDIIQQDIPALLPALRRMAETAE